jgi:hypothetical protein
VPTTPSPAARAALLHGVREDDAGMSARIEDYALLSNTRGA